MAREEFKITKLVKDITVMNPEDGNMAVKEDAKYALDKDIKKWEDQGYKKKSVEVVYRNLSQKQKARYLEGKFVKKTRKEKTPAELAKDNLFKQVAGSSAEELSEVVEQYELDVVLGKYPTTADKQAAVIKALDEQEKEEAEARKEAEADDVATEEVPVADEEIAEIGEDITEDEALIQRVKGCTVKDLKALIKELDLDINLNDYNLKEEKQDAVIAVIKNKD